jgi:hypothetical protein
MLRIVPPPGDDRESAGRHIFRRLPAELARGAWETLRESLPSDEREAGAFVAGMAWAFAIFFGLLILTTIVYARAAGVRL